jgi:hypothetical protein
MQGNNPKHTKGNNMSKNLVKGFVNYNADYTENLYYELNGRVYGCFNIKRPNSTFWPKGKEYTECTKPETWEFIGNYDLNAKN